MLEKNTAVIYGEASALRPVLPALPHISSSSLSHAIIALTELNSLVFECFYVDKCVSSEVPENMVDL